MSQISNANATFPRSSLYIIDADFCGSWPLSKPTRGFRVFFGQVSVTQAIDTPNLANSDPK